MKKTSFVLVLVVGLFAAGVALADAPMITLDPVGPLDYATFPQAYDVTGTIQHGSGSNGLNPVDSVDLYIDGTFESTQAIANGIGSSFGFSLPWNITSAGTYMVEVRAVHGAAEGSDSEEVTVTMTVLPPVVVTECPAAPAIAAGYMRNDLGIKAGSKTWQSIMKQVAGETGSHGSLWAANACDADYADDVKAFVDSI